MFSLDDVVYNAVSKPLFELLQKWFHWNRFQLISACLLAEAVASACVGIGILVPIGHRDVNGVDLIFGLVFSMTTVVNCAKYTAVKMDLKACSDVFESGGMPKPSTKMLMYMASAAHRDEIAAIFFMLSAAMWLVSLFSGGSLIVMFIFVLWTTALFNRHLWRSSDIDPKDRKTLLNSKEHPASASE